MKSLKDKMYTYEVPPPPETWQTIAASLDELNVRNVQPLKKSSKFFYFGLAAASITVIVFSVFIWFNIYNRSVNEAVSLQAESNTIDDGSRTTNKINNKITIPEMNEDGRNLASRAEGDRYDGNINSGAETDEKKYITISGPQGQPVKISAKVASLIVSSDNQYPPNAVWSEKVKEWKDIMKANTLAPTTANFLDIVELTHALRINSSNP